MGTKYFSKQELESYRDQGLSHGEMIDSDEHGIIYRAMMSRKGFSIVENTEKCTRPLSRGQMLQL